MYLEIEPKEGTEYFEVTYYREDTHTNGEKIFGPTTFEECQIQIRKLITGEVKFPIAE